MYSMADRGTSSWNKLCLAAYCGRVDILQLFLGHKTFPKSDAGQQLEILASSLGYPQCDPDEYSENGDTALIIAARKGHLGVCRELLSHGASVNKLSQSTGESALAIAIDHHHLDVVDLLLSEGCEVQTYDNVRSTPLYAAVRTQDPAYVDRLIRRGADPDAGSQDHTPIFLAARLGLLQVAKILEEAGCCLDASTSRGVTPLHEACVKGHVEMVEYLISKGCDVNRVDHQSCSPLLSASAVGHLDVCKLLVHAGADVNLTTQDKENPLNLALMNGHADVAEFLLQQGLEVCPAGEYRNSVRTMLQRNHREAVAVLLPWCSHLSLTDWLDWPYLGIHSHIWDDRRLLRMLILSGIKGGNAVVKLMVPSKPNNNNVCPHEEFLLRHHVEPLSLKSLTRIVIRRRLNNQVVSLVELLPLPRYLRNYVALKEL